MIRNPYDDMLYESRPFRQSHIDNLASIAGLFGLAANASGPLRVLELGCAGGGNLIPLAASYPDGQFLGIDASAAQVALGVDHATRAGVANVELRCTDLLDLGGDLGLFDYVICHGVFSWVPPAVQDRILAICKDNLAPAGVAYVSYNVLPGWRMRGVVRDAMLFQAKAAGAPADQVRQARAVVDFLADAAAAKEGPYGAFLKDEAQTVRGHADYYLFHEYLEEQNEPVYFHQFMARATARGLQYLGEAEPSTMSMDGLPTAVRTTIQTLSADVVEAEQYLDFVRNRMFRQTLLCHAQVRLDRKVTPDRLVGVHVACSAKPETPVVDVQSKAEAVFKGRHATTRTTEPLMKAALLHLGQAWPRSVAFTELVALARSRLSPEAVVVDPAAVLTADSRRLAEPLLQGFWTKQVELSVQPSRFVVDPGERPTGFRYARLQAETNNTVTTMRHESAHLTDLQRRVLPLLDGRRDRAALLDALAAAAAAGDLVVRDDAQPITDPAQVRRALEGPLGACLAQLGRLALLTA